MWVGEAAMMGDIISLYSPKKPYSITLDSTVLFYSVLCLMWLHPWHRFSCYQKYKSIIVS